MVNWKLIFIITAIIAAIIIAFLLVKRKGISFDFDMGSNLSGILNLLNSRYSNEQSQKLGAYITIPIKANIRNERMANTILNNIVGSISYDGNPIIQTNPGSPSLQSVAVQGRSSTPISDNVQLLINESSVKFINELIKGNNPIIQYNFGATVKGKPYSFNKTTTLKKS